MRGKVRKDYAVAMDDYAVAMQSLLDWTLPLFEYLDKMIIAARS